MIIVYFTMLIQVIFLQVVDGRRFLQIKKKFQLNLLTRLVGIWQINLHSSKMASFQILAMSHRFQIHSVK